MLEYSYEEHFVNLSLIETLGQALYYPSSYTITMQPKVWRLISVTFSWFVVLFAVESGKASFDIPYW